MSGSRPAGARVLPFRRRQFVARRRRANPWLAMARAFGISALLVAVPVGTVGWVWKGSDFRLRRVEVIGCRQVPEQWIREQLAPLIGRPLLTLRLAPVAERLRRNAWVGEVTLEKRLPDGMRLRIEERRPAAVFRNDQGGLSYVDSEGNPIAPYDVGHGPVDLPLVAGGDRPGDIGEAVRLAGELAALEPGWGTRVSEIQPLGAGDFRVYTADYGFPVLLSRPRLASSLESLRRNRRVLERAYPQVAALDLRFDRQIIIQPKS